MDIESESQDLDSGSSFIRVGVDSERLVVEEMEPNELISESMFSSSEDFINSNGFERTVSMEIKERPRDVTDLEVT